MKEQVLVRSRGTIWSLWWWLKAIVVLPVFGWWAHRLTVTDMRVILESGVLSKQQRSVRLENVLDVVISQGPIGRIMGHGTLAIETAGTGGTEFVFKGLQGVGKVRAAIYRQMPSQRR